MLERVIDWLVYEQEHILFVEDISGLGFLFLTGVVAFVAAMCVSKKFRKIFF